MHFLSSDVNSNVSPNLLSVAMNKLFIYETLMHIRKRFVPTSFKYPVDDINII